MTATETRTDRNESHPVPERESTDKARAGKDAKIDAQVEDSFPASDPPSYSGGNHAIGAPSGRESEPPCADDEDVKEAQKKAHQQEKKA